MAIIVWENNEEEDENNEEEDEKKEKGANDSGDEMQMFLRPVFASLYLFLPEPL